MARRSPIGPAASAITRCVTGVASSAVSLHSQLADLGYGEFDGAHLVANFELLNPARHFWSKYYELYRNVDDGRRQFLEFERWWGGYHFMTEAEIR